MTDRSGFSAGGFARRLPLVLLLGVACLVATLAVARPAEAAAPESKPWIHTRTATHLGFQLYWWDGFTSAQPDPSVTGYDVQYKQTGATSWTDLSHSGTVRAAQFSNLTPGQTYQVRIRATNSDGNGPWSDIEDVPAVVSRPTTVDPPFPLVVEAGNAQATVSWGAPSHAGGKTLNGYVIRLYLDDEATPLRSITVRGASTASKVISGLTNDTAYQVVVYATYVSSPNDGSGAPTGRVPFTPSAAQVTPQNAAAALVEPTTLAISPETGSATFAVTLEEDPGSSVTVRLVRFGYGLNPAYGAAGHVWDRTAVEVSPSELTFTSGNYSDPQTVTVTGLPDGDTSPDQLVILILSPVTADYHVYTYVGAGNGDWNLAPNGGWVYASGSGAYTRQQGTTYGPVGGSSNSISGVFVTVADDGALGVPTNLRAVAGQLIDGRYWKLRFSWDAPTGGATVTGYDLQYRKRTPGRAASLAPTWSTVTGITATSAETRRLDKGTNHPEGTTYEYRVRANTADGAGEWSPVAVAELQDPGNRVTDLTATPGNGQLSLAWTAPKWPAEGYLVHYKLASANVGPFQFANNPANGWVNANHSGTTTSLVIPNLTNGVAYNVRVRLASPHHDHPAAGATATPSSGSSGTGREPERITRLGIAPDSSSGTAPTDGSVPPPVDQTPPDQHNDYADLIAKIHQWRNDPCCVHHPDHTQRWDRVLLTLGETVDDQTLEPMTAAEAQGYADRGWTRWVDVAEALRELESPTQPQTPDQTPDEAPESTAELSEIAARYDADSNGTIDLAEYRRAVDDYTAGRITYTEMLEVVNAYRMP